MTLFVAQVVKWSALGKEALIALIAGLGVVGAWGLVVIGATRFQSARREHRGPTATAHLSVAAVGAVVCVGAVAVGIVAMTHKS